jgi:hypothetical protein
MNDGQNKSLHPFFVKPQGTYARFQILTSIAHSPSACF